MKTCTKKIIMTIVSFMILAFSAKAQYVNIPDANFRAWLQTTIPGAMNPVGQMDTTSNLVVNRSFIDVSNRNIADLNGIQYFDNLDALYCQQNKLTSLPKLPKNLTLLNCSKNQLVALPVLPLFLDILDCSNNNIAAITSLPTLVRYVDCSYNAITNLPALPGGLETLYSGRNFLASLPELPTTLIDLNVYDNLLTALPTLPSGLVNLNVGYNFICSIPSNLPVGAYTDNNFCLGFNFQNACGEKAATFSAFTPQSTSHQYTWSFGDGSTATVDNPSHIYVSNGRYTISLSVKTTVNRGGNGGEFDPPANYIDKVLNVNNNLIVASIPVVKLGEDVKACASSYALRAGSGFSTYKWQDGSTDSIFVATKSGKYTVIVTNEKGCTATDEIELLIDKEPVVTNLANQYSICSASISLDAGSGFSTYKWQDGSTDQIFTAKKPGIYDVTVTNSLGCSFTQQVTVSYCSGFEKLKETLKVPNVFTPNGDGKNEYFEIKNLSDFPLNKLEIYNRWGTLVYESSNYQNNWNAFDIAPGVYFYQLTVAAPELPAQTITGWVDVLAQK